MLFNFVNVKLKQKRLIPKYLFFFPLKCRYF